MGFYCDPIWQPQPKALTNTAALAESRASGDGSKTTQVMGIEARVLRYTRRDASLTW